MRSLDPALIADIKAMRERITNTNSRRPRRRIVTLILSQGLRLTLALVLAGILGVACGACFGPAWSATRIDPVETLRRD